MFIESGIPIPTSRVNNKRLSWDYGEFPFDQMEVGDSFGVAPPEGGHLIYTQNKVSGAAAKLHRESNLRFTTRQMGDHVRCWRVA